MASTLGYQSLTEEVSDVEAEVTGTIPSWLGGTFCRVGPALFEIGEESFHHWFDGQAMVYAFNFRDGKCRYSNHLLETPNLKSHRAAGRIAVSEFGTDPCSTIFGRFKTLYEGQHPYANTNINVGLMAGKMIAMTESPYVMEFSLSPLRSIGDVNFGDEVNGVLSTAHPHYTRDGSTINYITQAGMENSFLIYKTPTGTTKDSATDTPVVREVIAKVPCYNNKIRYMHSFAQTENYTILVEFPWIFSLPRMLGSKLYTLVFGGEKGSAIDAFDWCPELGTIFTLVNVKDGSVQRYKGPATFAYHHVNAWEDGDKIKVDVVTYDEPGYGALDLKTLRKGVSSEEFDVFKTGKMSRFTINTAIAGDISLPEPQVTEEVLINRPVEFPRINYDANNCREYRYWYGVSAPTADEYQGETIRQGICKVDVEKKSTQLWFDPNCEPSEPVFIANPEEKSEDDGVVVSVMLDYKQGKSFLLILDAASFKEIARAQLPHHNPMGLHGAHFK